MKRLLEANQKRSVGELTEAMKIYEDILQTKMLPDVMRVLALTYFELYLNHSEIEAYGERAVYWINQAITMAPGCPEFYITRAVLSGFGVVDAPDYTRAANDYRRALHLNPNLPQACLGLASLEGTPEDVVSLEEAIAVVQHASGIDSDNPIVWLRLGSLYYKQGYLERSTEAYGKALLCPEPLSPQDQIEIKQKIEHM